ncbi:hypothetical protein [Fodinicola feengrottensis]|uniref:hypothetical protein n=1 Tax=Fodinicola feengrottensis TaxID=435914 RepID=UPI002442B2B0|nr:hypothetical protein [Fodinicola feengrottensis]
MTVRVRVLADQVHWLVDLPSIVTLVGGVAFWNCTVQVRCWTCPAKVPDDGAMASRWPWSA